VPGTCPRNRKSTIIVVRDDPRQWTRNDNRPHRVETRTACTNVYTNDSGRKLWGLSRVWLPVSFPEPTHGNICRCWTGRFFDGVQTNKKAIFRKTGRTADAFVGCRRVVGRVHGWMTQHKSGGPVSVSGGNREGSVPIVQYRWQTITSTSCCERPEIDLNTAPVCGIRPEGSRTGRPSGSHFAAFDTTRFRFSNVSHVSRDRIGR